jgi:hypothetical protein
MSVFSLPSSTTSLPLPVAEVSPRQRTAKGMVVTQGNQINLSGAAYVEQQDCALSTRSSTRLFGPVSRQSTSNAEGDFERSAATGLVISVPHYYYAEPMRELWR